MWASRSPSSRCPIRGDNHRWRRWRLGLFRLPSRIGPGGILRPRIGPRRCGRFRLHHVHRLESAPDNSWYCFARISDDTLKIENEDPLKWWRDDTLSITVDSDHSGGSIYGFTREELVNGQRYYARVLPLKHPRLPHGQAGFSRPAPRSFPGGVPVGDAQTPFRHRVDDAPTRRGQRRFARRIYL